MLAIIDSGVGGLSIFQEFKKLYPNHGVLYFADRKYMPYGEQDPETLLERGRFITSFLKEQGATHIAIGCNTLFSCVGEALRTEFPHIPFFSITESAIKMATPFPKIGLLATEATIRSGYFQTKLEGKLAFALSCPTLAPMVESGKFSLSLLKDALKKVPISPPPLLIGCTHFSFLKEKIASLFPTPPLFLDPNALLASHLPPLGCDLNDIFFTTSAPKTFQKIAQTILDTKLPFPYFVKSLYSNVNLFLK